VASFEVIIDIMEQTSLRLDCFWSVCYGFSFFSFTL